MGRDLYRIYDPKAPHFLTATVVQWLPVFSQPANVQILLDSLAFLQREQALVLYGYVIMENHCHLLAEAPDLGQAMSSFKSFTARRIVERLAQRRSPVLDLLAWHKVRHKTDREHQVWQRGPIQSRSRARR
jgi:REP element-mobilizing transposase RayT